MDDLILRTVSRALVPFVLVFSAYVTTGGHLSPGGGFSGGTIAAAGMILAVLACGYQRTAIARNRDTLRQVEALSALAYIVFGLAALATRHPFLSNIQSLWQPGRPGALFSSGLIWALGLAIGAKVASTFIGLYVRLNENEDTPEQGNG